MTRRCVICGREADDMVPCPDLAQDVDGLWWCPDSWACLFRAGGVEVRPAVEGLW